MVILGCPSETNIEYIKVNDSTSLELQKEGFTPIYMDDEFFYYERNKRIEILLEKIYEQGGEHIE